MTDNELALVNRITAALNKKPKKKVENCLNDETGEFDIPMTSYYWGNTASKNDDDCLWVSYNDYEQELVLYYPGIMEDDLANIVTWCGRNGMPVIIETHEGSYRAAPWQRIIPGGNRA